MVSKALLRSANTDKADSFLFKQMYRYFIKFDIVSSLDIPHENQNWLGFKIENLLRNLVGD